MLLVHHLQRSQSERIVWLCEELSIPYELKLYQRAPFFSPPDLAALTPLGAAPVIMETSPSDESSSSSSDPLILSESGAIAEYIIHKHGNGRLALGPTHLNYTDYLYWFHFANGGLQPMMLRAMQIRGLKLDANHPVLKNVNERLDLMLRTINERLLQATWLAGEEFTAADIMSVFSLSTMRMFFQLDLTPYPGIVAWLKRAGERPAYQRAMEKSDPGLVPGLDAQPPAIFPAFAARASSD